MRPWPTRRGGWRRPRSRSPVREAPGRHEPLSRVVCGAPAPRLRGGALVRRRRPAGERSDPHGVSPVERLRRLHPRPRLRCGVGGDRRGRPKRRAGADPGPHPRPPGRPAGPRAFASSSLRCGRAQSPASTNPAHGRASSPSGDELRHGLWPARTDPISLPAERDPVAPRRRCPRDRGAVSGGQWVMMRQGGPTKAPPPSRFASTVARLAETRARRLTATFWLLRRRLRLLPSGLRVGRRIRAPGLRCPSSGLAGALRFHRPGGRPATLLRRRGCRRCG